ncbi:hypothetical protein GF325_12440 [Candidatus Bathyarchaeota archaeon]|nr:hypothetical protein [Candidatus Bathyarchaeota archaeon]
MLYPIIMVVKAIDTDTLFKEWLMNADLKTLEEYFKKRKVDFKRDHVSVGETVKEVLKFIAIYFEKDVSKVMPDSGKSTIEQVPAHKLEKVTFFDFKGKNVELESWKHDREVPFFSTLKEMKCPKCDGKGYAACKSCQGKGHVSCKNCDGKGSVTCSRCKGKKTQEIYVDVIDATGKKDRAIKKVQCPDCFGQGTQKCAVCGGTKLVACKSCSGRGLDSCSECKGHGIYYQYEVKTIPVKQSGKEAEVFLTKSVEKFISPKMVEKSLAKRDLKGIVVKNYKDLNEKKLKPELNFWTKDSNKVCKVAQKAYKSLEKSKIIKKGTPIIVLPALQLNCQSVRKKKFEIFGIGTLDSFVVLDHDFE